MAANIFQASLKPAPHPTWAQMSCFIYPNGDKRYYITVGELNYSKFEISNPQFKSTLQIIETLKKVDEVRQKYVCCWTNENMKRAVFCAKSEQDANAIISYLKKNERSSLDQVYEDVEMTVLEPKSLVQLFYKKLAEFLIMGSIPYSQLVDKLSSEPIVSVPGPT